MLKLDSWFCFSLYSCHERELQAWDSNSITVPGLGLISILIADFLKSFWMLHRFVYLQAMQTLGCSCVQPDGLPSLKEKEGGGMRCPGVHMNAPDRIYFLQTLWLEFCKLCVCVGGGSHIIMIGLLNWFPENRLFWFYHTSRKSVFALTFMVTFLRNSQTTSLDLEKHTLGYKIGCPGGNVNQRRMLWLCDLH